MAHRKSWWVALLLACAVVAWMGCRPAAPPEDQPGPAASPAEPAPDEPDAGASAEAKVSKSETPKPEPPPPPKIPEVHLPDHLAKASLVRVGDPLPEGELTTLEGQPQPLKPLVDQKLAVVFLWKGGDDTYAQMAAVDALEFLGGEVFKPYEAKGVSVVAINAGDPAEKAKETASQASPTYPVLLDPQGQYFAKLATERLPRIYLLDAEGKVLWFDTEYSRTTRANLLQGISVALGESAAKP